MAESIRQEIVNLAHKCGECIAALRRGALVDMAEALTGRGGLKDGDPVVEAIREQVISQAAASIKAALTDGEYHRAFGNQDNEWDEWGDTDGDN